MSSRMDKYYKEKKQDMTESRTRRNKDIYSEVSDDEYEKLNLKSNVSVIKTDSDLDIDSIKEIINEKYKRPKMRMHDIDDYEDEQSDSEEEDTKEYDLKKVIETAHKNKTPDYDRERFAHLRETQYDILNSLNIGPKGQDTPKDESLSEEEVTIINLIKTVNENAEKNHAQANADDLMSDLMGDGETEVLKPITFDEEEEPDKKPTIVEELEKTKQISRHEIDTELDKLSEPVDEQSPLPLPKQENRELTKTQELSNSFYTGNYQIDKNDLDDFLDLEKEMKGGSIVVKILIIIIVLITIAVAVYLLNKYLNLGLF